MFGSFDMAIDFDGKRWQRVRENARLWWEGRLGRPLIQLRVRGRDPGRPAPKLSRVSRDTTSYDLSIAPEDIVDWWDYDLSCVEYLADAFPCVWPDFGPGVLAAFLGARPEPATGTVWFHSPDDREIKDIKFEYDPENVWLKRVRDICRIAMDRWDGLVQVAMTDLGGNLDVLSTFRPGEKLLTDLLDFPDEVIRLTWEEHRAWWRCFEDIDAILRKADPGYTAWCPIFSETPYYMLQCDFAYMIGPKMFDKFVRPELAASCRRLQHAFYHLDGVGQLPHLDSLLSIPELKGIQWVPGAGKPQGDEWPDVYRKIFTAGKRAEYVGDWRKFDRLADKLGTTEGFVMFVSVTEKDRKEAEAFAKKYGAL
ncbi:MAG: hypothetical protein N3A38_09190 [Planctomycetota bacterium]|nr:hypothetical protein [Planctomycetota bacterium]